MLRVLEQDLRIKGYTRLKFNILRIFSSLNPIQGTSYIYFFRIFTKQISEFGLRISSKKNPQSEFANPQSIRA